MASLGRITNALIAATNENTLQLAGFNIDFSLLKVEAPKEFMGLGAVLSPQRKINAEDGPLHRTARKLGALFEQLLPSTPTLIRAYGQRATAIFQTPGINPKGTKKDGPFESFVGADGTSLWAAATSGHSAVAVYLLACMLARKWDAQVATSIWVELVAERKQEVEKAFKEGNVTSMTIVLAAGQELSREELSLWDDSARAWLQSADVAKTAQQKQLELILKNVDIPISSGTNPYTNVVSAWIQAMVGLEQILLGVPQQISDGSVLLALSAWHIFPDLLVLGNKTVNVKFRDQLVPGSGVITIGLQNNDPNQGKIKWSLALSHLRYYGDPVEVTSGDIKSRVLMDQLPLAAFGTVMSSWGASMEETIPLAMWFVALWAKLEETSNQDTEMLRERQPLHKYLNWLYVLVEAAKHLLACKGDELDVAVMIVGFGHRRGSKFLGILEKPLPPLFGLCNRAILRALQKETNVDRGISFLREFSKAIGYEDGDAFISFKGHAEGNSRGPIYQEYATAVPHSSGKKRCSDGELKHDPKFWHSLNFSPGRDDDGCDCESECGTTCPCTVNKRICTWNCHTGSNFDIRIINCRNSGTAFDKRAADIFSQGEFCGAYGCSIYELSNEEEPLEAPRVFMEWVNPPLLFSNLPKLPCAPSTKLASASPSAKQPRCCYEPCHLHIDLKDPTPNLAGKPDVRHLVLFELHSLTEDSGFGLWVKGSPDGQSHPNFNSRLSLADLLLNTDDSTSFLPTLSPDGLFEYFRVISGTGANKDSAMDLLLRITTPLEVAFCEALNTLSFASKVYKNLHGATVPLAITSMNLGSARWMEKNRRGFQLNRRTSEPSVSISRCQALACIMMFESGTLNLDPDGFKNVMAISSGNSIFVPKALLSDPFEDIHEGELQRFVGNIGKPGITLMVCPQNPKARRLTDDFQVVRHAKYDFKREDNFKETTLHLSFTDWKLPLDTGTNSWGNISKDVHYVESVVSVHDRGVWVADINLLKECNKLWRLDSCSCNDQEKQASQDTSMSMRLTSVDCWDELLDTPNGIGVFRARGNWAARLAAASILGRRSNVKGAYRTSMITTIIVGPTVPCLKCAHRITSNRPRFGLDLRPKGSFFFID